MNRMSALIPATPPETPPVRNPIPEMFPFLDGIYRIYDGIAGAGIWLSAIGVVLAGIGLIFMKYTGGVGRVVPALLGAVGGYILIVNAGSALGWLS